MIFYTRVNNSQRFYKVDLSTKIVESVYVSDMFPTVERQPVDYITCYGPKYSFITEEEYQASRIQVLIKLDVIPVPPAEPAEAITLSLATVSVEEVAGEEDPHKDLPF